MQTSFWPWLSKLLFVLTLAESPNDSGEEQASVDKVVSHKTAQASWEGVLIHSRGGESLMYGSYKNAPHASDLPMKSSKVTEKRPLVLRIHRREPQQASLQELLLEPPRVNREDYESKGKNSSTLPMRWNYGRCCSLGKFYVEVGLGTPPQRFRLSPDTGSAYLAVPSSTCSACTPSMNSFDMTQSSTTKQLACSPSCKTCDNGKCAFSIRYVDGSGYNATVLRDRMDLDAFGAVYASARPTVSFGAISIEVSQGVPFQPPNVDGIWGLAYRSLIDNHSTPFDDLVEQKVVTKDLFTVCMGKAFGALYLGDEGLAAHAGPLQYTPIVKEKYYSIDLRDLRLSGVSIGVAAHVFNAYDTIVDSGSTDIILPQPAYAKLKSAMIALCHKTPLVGVCHQLYDNSNAKSLFEQYCYHLTPKQLAAFPTLGFEVPDMQGGTFFLEVPPDMYLQSNRCLGAGTYGLGIDPALHADGSTVLGDVFMQAYTIVHDRAQRRLGFAKTGDSCDPEGVAV